MSVSRWSLPALVATTLVAALLAAGAPATAAPPHPRVVSEHPVAWTPHIKDGTVHAVTAVGELIVVGGTFTEVHDASREFEFERHYLVAFDRRDGRLSRFDPQLDGPVQSLAPGPDGTVYVGGAFRTVNGAAQRGITQLRLDTGQQVADFQAAINWGDVRAMTRHGAHLYLGGTFTAINGTARAGLARLNAGTGRVDPGFDADLSNREGPRVNIQDLALRPDGERLVAVGAFTHSHEWMRPQLVMMDTAGDTAELADWYTDAYESDCASYFHTYLRGVDFSPDGSYLVAVTTGSVADPDRLCNTAARFEATGTGMHRPTWANHTGGNSLYSVAITGAAVYVGGHQQWMDNPHGDKAPGPGAVAREGIAAIDPDGGKALPWNPGRARGVGVQAFLATQEGLFVGSDTTRLGGVTRERIGMLPLAETVPPPAPPPEPEPEPEPPAETDPWSWLDLGRLLQALFG